MIKDGIDVSQYQGDIDWERVKKRIDFVIIRCGYGQDNLIQDDRMFKRNADACTRLNIPFGVYLYSYATNEEEAKSEARHVIRLIREYQLTYPVFYDLEDSKVGRLTNEQIKRNAKAFCDEIMKNQYLPGIYANLYWWKNKLTDDLYNQWAKWIASYSDELNYDGSYDIWQYSQTGFVEGIEGYVDLNYGNTNNLIKLEDTQNILKYKVGDHVTFDHVYISSDSTMPLIPYMNHGVITRVQKDAKNPYLIGEGLGWVNDNTILNKEEYLSNLTYQGDSFVDALNEIGIDSSFENRNKIAKENGINPYNGSARQNLELLMLLKEGRLKYRIN